MRSLETIKRVNNAKGVGRKLGQDNGDPLAISYTAEAARGAVREHIIRSVGPVSYRADYIADAVDATIAREAA